MANKPFNISYEIAETDGFVMINGEQVTRIVAKRLGDKDEWEITFHLSDGTTYTTTPNANLWAKKFVEETFDTETK